MNNAFSTLLDVAIAHRLIDPASMQVFTIDTVLQSPPSPAAQKVSPWVEEQKLGRYQPPRLPYPLVCHTPALIWGSAVSFDVGLLAAVLGERYPDHHPLTIIAVPGDTVHSCQLRDLPTVSLSDAQMVALVVPALPLADDRRGFERLQWVVSRLLGPDGCPWDVRQTHQSLRQHLIAEVYEAVEALDTGNMTELCEELGDVLLQVFVHSEMARQAGTFTLEDVIQTVADKLVFRHPHVFATTEVDGPEQVLRNWYQLKAQEQAAKGKVRNSALDGVPVALPALMMAQEFSRKAIRAGFTWQDLDQVWAKVTEELHELRIAADPAAQQVELGDLLFALATLAHWLKLDAEIALRDAAMRYKQRFQFVEQMAAQGGRALQDCSLAEMMVWWAEAKKMGDGR
ncbi:nucleoside triphosphate pyrophosphohydrolase [Chloroflexus sp.]|uniref:nucleoside triphosphate pyrophosphohydrolase n=1 Tax=Chloroflexus sp. TaxID=1904827 RepID=UPI002ADD8662|nr:nucleoside triphosphate pyrophosphohydrolase [Chloroflexus sp.]